MLTRPSPDSISDNPIIDSPYNATYQKGLGHFPIDDAWDLLEGDHFSQLSGDHWAFLGPF